MFRQVSLPQKIRGALYLHKMPGRDDEPLAKALDEIENKAVVAIICLTSLAEIEKKPPAYAAAIAAGSLPVERVVFPIEDFSVPQDTTAFIALAQNVAG